MSFFKRLSEKRKLENERLEEEQRQRLERLGLLEKEIQKKGFHLPHPIQTHKLKQEINRLKLEIDEYERKKESRKNEAFVGKSLAIFFGVICVLGIFAGTIDNNRGKEDVVNQYTDGVKVSVVNKSVEEYDVSSDSVSARFEMEEHKDIDAIEEKRTVEEEQNVEEEQGPISRSNDVEVVSTAEKEHDDKPNYTYKELSAIKYAKTSLNVRSAPSVDAEKIGTLSESQKVNVTGQCNETGWYRIEYGSTFGYVSEGYLQDEKVERHVETISTENDGAGENHVIRNTDVIPEPSVQVPDVPQIGENMVWIPVNGGKKYHLDKTCSGMVDPMQTTKEQAEKNGFTPCKKCFH